MPGASPNLPLALLNPGEFLANLDGSVPGVGRGIGFANAVANQASGAVAAVASGALPAALAAFGYGTMASGLTAATGGIAAATPVTTQFAAFGTVPSGAGAQLPLPSAMPYPVWVANFGVSGLSVFPPTASGQIGSAASGAAYVQATGIVTPYYFAGGNQDYHG